MNFKDVIASPSLNDTTIAFLWAIAGILLGGGFTYIATRLEIVHNYRQAQRDRLLALRTESFRRLWKITGQIQRHPDAATLNKFPARDIVASLNSWYFDDGGIYLTNKCREVYFALIEELAKASHHSKLDIVRYQEIYSSASKLRATLAHEIDTRIPLNPPMESRW